MTCICVKIWNTPNATERRINDWIVVAHPSKSLFLYFAGLLARCVNILNSTHYSDVETTSSCKRYLEVTSWILPSFLYFTFEFRFVRLARHLHQQQRRAPAAILLVISSRLAVELAKKMEYCARSLWHSISTRLANVEIWQCQEESQNQMKCKGRKKRMERQIDTHKSHGVYLI